MTKGIESVHYRKEKNGWIIVLTKGEEVVSTLNRFFDENGIKGGFLYGLGAVTGVELMVYNPRTKGYDSKNFGGETFELLNITASVSETGLHAHVALAGPDFKALGGHLKKAVVAATLEAFLIPTGEVKREFDEKAGLKLMKL